MRLGNIIKREAIPLLPLEVTPHNWLLTLRVEVAKQKLREGRLSLRDVA